ncbi:hypothetical protein COL154_012321 [Colletotrichum chrysophilum]|nr:hypothetical protein KNSL1_009098 [Colletotrichum chrysophilum]KAJ0352954.1 hypothetical protein COL154_012321 [Colletotrichum chrysophilum]
MYFATQSWGWPLVAERDGRKFDLESAMIQAKQAGLRGWEHYFATPDDVSTVVELAQKVGLELHSAYIPGAFHEPELAEAATKNFLQVAAALRDVGVRTLICNPDPLDWDKPDSLKTEAQLHTQLAAINKLGAALAAAGSRLLYHSHDPEMQGGAREFHHILVNTDPAYMGLCLDAHWIYRGSSNSQRALHDIISLYANRIEMIHLRQSKDHIWTESIGPGDIDYPALAEHLKRHNVKALMTLELGAEKGTPHELTPVQAHTQPIQYLEPILLPFAVEPDVTTGDRSLPWRINLIGAGAIARLHANAVKNMKDLGPYQLLAADPSQKARNGFKEAFPKAIMFESGDEMLASSPAQDRDIVIVAVPPIWHHSTALAAIQSNRHVLCEKPVTMTTAELDDLLAAIQKTGRHFGDCSVRFLCNDALDRAREIVASGAIGSPYHVRLVNRIPRIRSGIEFQPDSKWFLDKEIAGGGIGFDWGPYDLGVLFDVLRPVAATIHHAFMACPKTGADPTDQPITVETHIGATLTLKLESGAAVTLDYERASCVHGEHEATLNVDGTAGGLSWEWCPSFQNNAVKLTQYVDVDGIVDKQVEHFRTFSYDDVHGRPLVAFVDLVAGRRSVILPENRLKFNYSILVAMYKSAAEGKPTEVHL